MDARIIFNPAAAGGRVARQGPQVHAWLMEQAVQAGVTVEWVETQAPGHAVALAEEAARRGDGLVVAAGGDGTVNEVVNGLMGTGENRSSLGIIPLGSGNDLAWLAGIPLDPQAACRRLFTGDTRRVDVGHIREASGRARYFDNGCGVGFDAQVGVEVQSLRWLRGFSMYLVGVLKTLVLHHQAPRLHIWADDWELVRPTMMLTLGNGRRHGGGFLVTPDACLDDGLLEVCIAGELSRLGILMIIPRFVRGTHVTHPRVRMFRARRVRVVSPVPVPIHLDGEIFATDAQAFEVTIVPGALRLRV